MERGTVSITTFVFIILAVAGAIIAGVVYVSISFTGTTDEETCHTSVIARSLPQIPGLPEADIKDFIPLNCRTQKYCITAGLFSGSCQQEFKDVGRIEKIKVKTKIEIEDVIAKEMYDCWTMMGEGKVQFYSKPFAQKYGLGPIASNCVICSRIAFDENSLEKNTELTVKDLKEVNPLEYMMSHKVPGKNISYASYFGGAVSSNSIQISEETKKELVGYDEEDVKKDLDSNSDPYSELAVVFMQINAPSYGESALNIGAKVVELGGASMGIIGPKATVVYAVKGVAACVASVYCAAVVILAGLVEIGSIEYNKGVAASYCEDLHTGEEPRNGCSAVRVVNYNITQIKDYCEVIESIS